MTLSIEPQTVQEGERVVFTCQATANPEILGYRCKAWGLGAPWAWSGGGGAGGWGSAAGRGGPGPEP